MEEGVFPPFDQPDVDGWDAAVEEETGEVGHLAHCVLGEEATMLGLVLGRPAAGVDVAAERGDGDLFFADE